MSSFNNSPVYGLNHIIQSTVPAPKSWGHSGRQAFGTLFGLAFPLALQGPQNPEPLFG